METDGERAIEALRDAVLADPENAAFQELGYVPVFRAHPDARILVVGQAPGRRAQASEVPFDDASGARLRDWLGFDEATFRDPARVAIVPMDFFYPGRGAGGDLPPRRGFAARWHPPLLALMPRIRLTLLIGAYAQAHYLGPRRRDSLTETVRAYHDHLPELMPLVHPSPLNFRWHARNPWFETEVVPELRELVRGDDEHRPEEQQRLAAD
ncbi:MAG: uracil-DNA glycosylase family protein [Microbacteriaceae bacterium]|nr:MAG: uracil-DNA glycosylase family protein [Microbacteriaceae bacterium]